MSYRADKHARTSGTDRRHAGRGREGRGREHVRAHERGTAAARRAQKDLAGPCPIMRECGGCEWLGMPYAKQLKRKHEAVSELMWPLLDRFGWDIDIDAILGMGGTSESTGKLVSPRGFRYKAATPFAPGPAGEVRCGFFAAGTHRIIPAAQCPVEADGARDILNEVARIAGHLHIAAYNEDTQRGLLRHAVVRLGWKRREGILTVVTSNRDLPHASDLAHALLEIDPRITCVAHNVNPRPGNAILGPATHVIAGEPYMLDELMDCTFAISPTAFYQTNPQQTEALYRLAIEGMALEEGDVLLDAYCGSGTIGICAARAAAVAGAKIRLIGVERNPASIPDARLNAERNGLAPDDATFVTADATAFLRQAVREGTRIDVVTLDPPRAGSTEAFLNAAMAANPKRIVYVSCNPVTQVRDLAVLGSGGYRLERITPVDMFPHTSHIETVAVLSRRAAGV